LDEDLGGSGNLRVFFISRLPPATAAHRRIQARAGDLRAEGLVQRLDVEMAFQFLQRVAYQSALQRAEGGERGGRGHLGRDGDGVQHAQPMHGIPDQAAHLEVEPIRPLGCALQIVDERRRGDDGGVGGEWKVGGAKDARARGASLGAQHVPALLGHRKVQPGSDQDASWQPPVPDCAQASFVARCLFADLVEQFVGQFQRAEGWVEKGHGYISCA
jgi:hypothetical protein